MSTKVLFPSKLKCWGYPAQKGLAKGWGYPAHKWLGLSSPKGACQRLGLSSPQVVGAIQPKRCLPVGAIQPKSVWAIQPRKCCQKLGLSSPKVFGLSSLESVAKSWGFPAQKCWGYPAQEVLQQAGAVFFSHALLSLLQPAIFISFQALASPRLLPLSSIFFICPARFWDSPSPCGDTTWITCLPFLILRAHEANIL